MLYVANWKMEMPFAKALAFCKNNYDAILELSKSDDKKIVFCPSFTEAQELCGIFKNSEVAIGAQDCSSKKIGPYTGQVAAESLHQIGCSYCIVGHSEQRDYCKQSDEQIGQKVVQLIEVAIEPIVCIGEKKMDYDAGIAENIIKTQLEAVFEEIEGHSIDGLSIAYEPVWSIGTGITPQNSYIEEVFDIVENIAANYEKNAQINLLYGGSVNEANIKNLLTIRNIGGFLIGGASLDFKKFEKIVQL